MSFQKVFQALFFGCFSFLVEFSTVLWKSRGFASVIYELLGLWKTKKTPYFLGVSSNLMSKSSASSGRPSCFLMSFFNSSIAMSVFFIPAMNAIDSLSRGYAMPTVDRLSLTIRMTRLCGLKSSSKSVILTKNQPLNLCALFGRIFLSFLWILAVWSRGFPANFSRLTGEFGVC